MRIFDRDGDGVVDVSELLQGMKSALDGCVAGATVCAEAAAHRLQTCVADVNRAQRDCYLTNGAACAADDSQVAAALEALATDVTAGCPNAPTVRAAGYGPSSTPAGLVRRLQSACRAEPAALAARSFGGPQGLALAAGTTAARTCLSTTHAAAAQFLRDTVEKWGQSLLALQSPLLFRTFERDCPRFSGHHSSSV